MTVLVIPQCERVKKDGVRCGSPALRGKRLCYFHSRAPKRKPKRVVPQVPDPSDAMAVLNWTIRGLMNNKLDPKVANKILYRDRKSTRLNSSHIQKSRMPSSA